MGLRSHCQHTVTVRRPDRPTYVAFIIHVGPVSAEGSAYSVRIAGEQVKKEEGAYIIEK